MFKTFNTFIAFVCKDEKQEISAFPILNGLEFITIILIKDICSVQSQIKEIALRSTGLPPYFRRWCSIASSSNVIGKVSMQYIAMFELLN